MASRGALAALGVVVIAAVAAGLWWSQRPGGSGADVPIPPENSKPGDPQPVLKPAAVKALAKRSGGAGALVGSVRVFGTDKPVVGAKVSIWSEDMVLETTTQADGSFAIARIPKSDDWGLTVAATEGFGEAKLNGLIVLDRKTTDVGVVYLAPGFSVPGIVEDERGAPIPDAQVVVNEPRPNTGFDMMTMIRELPRPPRPTHTTQSDANGQFKLTGVPPGTYLVYAKKPGFATAVERQVLVAPTAATQPIRLVMAKGYSVPGRVVRKGEGGLAGIPVVAFTMNDFAALLDASMPTKVVATTDVKGEFTLEGLGAGEWQVVVCPVGEAMAGGQDLQVPRTTFLELKLEGGASLEGRITGEGDAPVAGAEVYCMTGKGAANAQTDSDGRYRMRGLAVGAAEMFLVHADGYCPYGTEGMFGGGASDAAKVELKEGENTKDAKLQPGGKVRGTIVEEGTTKPVAGATVSVFSPAALLGGAPVATTGEDGKFELSGVSFGSALLTVKKAGWCSIGPGDMAAFFGGMMGMGDDESKPEEKDAGTGTKIVLSKENAVVERTLGLSRAVSLRGRVLSPSGAPVAGARVSVAAQAGEEGGFFPPELMGAFSGSDATRLSDADGRFEIGATAVKGKFVLTAKSTGFLPARSAPIEIDGATPPPETELKLAAGGSIEGRVTDAAGAPIEGASLTWAAAVKAPSQPHEMSVDMEEMFEIPAAPKTTGADGSYRIAVVQPGEVSVHVKDGKHVAERREKIDVVEGKSVRVDLTMQSGYAISGRVVRVDGKPVQHAWVQVSREGAEARGGLDEEMTVEDDGRFRVSALAPGKYRLVGRGTKAGESEPVVVDAGADGVELRLPPEVVIAGVVRFKDGRPASGVQLRAKLKKADGAEEDGQEWKWAQSAADGTFSIGDVKQGAYDVSVEIGWGKGANIRPTSVKDVAAGTEGLVIEVEPGLTIAGRVVGADGAPAAKGKVTCAPASAKPKDVKPGDEEDAPDVEAGGGSWRTVNVHDGQFEVVGLLAGSFEVTVSCPGSAPQRRRLDAGAANVEFRLSAGGTIKGRALLPDGKPAAKARISFEDVGDVLEPDGEVVCGADGKFVVEHVPPGVHQLVATLTPDDTVVRPDGVIVSHGKPDENSDFVGDSGDVRVLEGQTVENVEIRLKKRGE